jgi:hypothetical protein
MVNHTAACKTGNHVFSQIDIYIQKAFDTNPQVQLVYLTILNLFIFIGLMNGILALQTFIFSRKIRITNSGVYLIVFSVCSLFYSVILEINILTLLHYRKFQQKNLLIYCTVCAALRRIVSLMCMWLSACIALERALIECFDYGLFERRRRSIITSCILLFLVTACQLLSIFGREPSVSSSSTNFTSYTDVCEIQFTPKALVANVIIDYLSSGIPFLVYIIANVLVLRSLTQHRLLLTDHSDYFKIWKKHRDFFIPPSIFFVTAIPLFIFNQQNKDCLLSPTSTSKSLHIFIALRLLTNFNAMIPFLLYINPSNVYLLEFWNTSPIGNCLRETKENRCCRSKKKTAKLTDINLETTLA